MSPPRLSAAEIERAATVASKFLDRFGVSTFWLLMITGAAGWYAVTIYKPDHEADMRDRRINAESHAKIAAAVEVLSKRENTWERGIELLGTKLDGIDMRLQKQSAQLEEQLVQKAEQGETLHEIAAQQREAALVLEKIHKGPVRTVPMPDGGQE